MPKFVVDRAGCDMVNSDLAVVPCCDMRGKA